MITQFDIEHMEDIIAGNNGNWFTAKLLRLMADADDNNLFKLANVYPVEFVHFALYKFDGIPSRYAFINAVYDYVRELQLNAPNAETFPHWVGPDGKSTGISLVSGRDF